MAFDRDKSDRGDRDSRGAGGARGRKPRRKVCQFCADKVAHIDYKEFKDMKLRRMISERAKILPRRISGTCAKHQRQLTIAIKRARHLAIIPYTTE